MSILFSPYLNVEISKDRGASYTNIKDIVINGKSPATGIESVNIELEIGLTGNISVNFSLPMNDALAFIDSDWVKMWNKFRIKWGYSGGLNFFSPSLVAEMTTPEVTFGNEVSFSINATTVSPLLSRFFDSANMERSILGTKDEVLDYISSKYGVEFNKEKLVNEPPGIEDEYAWERIVNQSDTDLVSLSRELGAIGVVILPSEGSDKITIKFRKDIFAVYPTAKFVWKMVPDIQKRIFPINEFSVEGSQWFLPSCLMGIKLGLFNINKESYQGEIGLVDSEVPVLTKERKGDGENPGEEMEKVESLNDIISKGNDIGKTIAISGRNENDIFMQEREIQYWVDQMAEEGFVTCIINLSFGVPDLFPTALIEVAGIGRRFSRVYEVASVRHTINASGGYEMEIHGRVNIHELFKSYLKEKPPVENVKNFKQYGPSNRGKTVSSRSDI